MSRWAMGTANDTLTGRTLTGGRRRKSTRARDVTVAFVVGVCVALAVLGARELLG